MKHKVIGFTAVAILFLFAAAGTALADGISSRGQDKDSDGLKFTADASKPLVHDASVTKDAVKDQDSDNKMHYDHVVAWSPDSHFHHSDSPDPTMPEPSALLLLAAGVTPLLWVRRKSI